MEKWVKYEWMTTGNLIKGKYYKVESIDLDSDTITLEGVEGKYNREIFKEVDESETLYKPTFIAFSKIIPKIGEELFLIRIDDGNIQPVKISCIEDISYVQDCIYRIETENSVYLTEIK